MKRSVYLIQAILLCYAAIPQCPAAEGRQQIAVKVNGVELLVISQREDANHTRSLIARRVTDYIVEKQCGDRGIVLPQQTLDSAIDKYFEVARVDEARAIVLREQFTNIVRSLRAVVVGGENSDLVYKRFLEHRISKADWSQWLRTHDTPEKISQLEQRIPSSVSDMKNESRMSIARDLRRWALFSHLTEGVPSESKEKVFQEWWAREVGALKLQLPPDFRDVTNELAPLQLPYLPQEIKALLSKSKR